MASQSQDLGWTFDGFDTGTLGKVAMSPTTASDMACLCECILCIN